MTAFTRSTSQMGDEFAEALEIISGRYYFVVTRRPDSIHRSSIAANNICYCIDNELVYEPFYADFGPLNLGKTYRFCELTRRLLQEAEHRNKKLYLFVGPQIQAKANAAVLLGIFQVLFLNRTADESWRLLSVLKPFQPFRDASCGVSTFHLTVQDCISGIQKAREVGFIDVRNGVWNFDLEEYEHYEQVENGDMNWILPGKLMAFSGPAARSTDYVGFRAMVPEDYWEVFKKRGITTVVRLNKKVYDRKRFLDGGLRHHELYFPDGSCPSEAILMKFLEIAEHEPGALAIHCKAGLGRTGVLICSYLMKHYRFTAEEVIGYIRICRPGSVIGPQQNFIKDIQNLMWHEGDIWRQSHGPSPPPLVSAVPHSGKTGEGAAQSPAVVPIMVDATAGDIFKHAGVVSNRPPSVMRSSKEYSIAATAASAAPVKTIADLSLTQLQERLSQGQSQHSIHVGQSYSNPAGAAAAYLGHSSSGKSLGAAAGRGRAPTPTRQNSQGHAPSNGGGIMSGILSATRPASQMVSRSASAATSAQTGRAPSAPRERTGAVASFLNGISSLRATLHTETVQAAARPKAAVPEALSQSSDFVSSGWRTPITSASPTTPGSRPQSNVSRVLAPNGQPRKVPSALLSHFTPGSSSRGPGALVPPPGSSNGSYSSNSSKYSAYH
eukprot:jgi/Chrzof1/8343/Cz03g06260.t1